MDDDGISQPWRSLDDAHGPVTVRHALRTPVRTVLPLKGSKSASDPASGAGADAENVVDTSRSAALRAIHKSVVPGLRLLLLAEDDHAEYGPGEAHIRKRGKKVDMHGGCVMKVLKAEFGF
jgi:hypothetical protein